MDLYMMKNWKTDHNNRFDSISDVVFGTPGDGYTSSLALYNSGKVRECMNISPDKNGHFDQSIYEHLYEIKMDIIENNFNTKLYVYIIYIYYRLYNIYWYYNFYQKHADVF